MSLDVSAIAAYLQKTNPDFTNNTKINVNGDVITVTYENGETQTLKTSDINGALSGNASIENGASDNVSFKRSALATADPEFIELVRERAIYISENREDGEKDDKGDKEINQVNYELKGMGYEPEQIEAATKIILPRAAKSSAHPVNPEQKTEVIPAEVQPEILNDTAPDSLRSLVLKKAELEKEREQVKKDMASGENFQPYALKPFNNKIYRLGNEIQKKGGTPEIEAGILKAVKEANEAEQIKLEAEIARVVEEAKAKAEADAAGVAELTTEEAEKTPIAKGIKTPGENITVINPRNTKGAINGTVSDIKYDDAGKLLSVKLTSNKSGNTFKYELDEKTGAYLNKKEGKYYRLGEDGNLVRDNSLNPKPVAPKHKTKVETELSEYIKRPDTQKLSQDTGYNFTPATWDEKSGWSSDTQINQAKSLPGEELMCIDGQYPPLKGDNGQNRINYESFKKEFDEKTMQANYLNRIERIYGEGAINDFVTRYDKEAKDSNKKTVLEQLILKGTLSDNLKNTLGITAQLEEEARKSKISFMNRIPLSEQLDNGYTRRSMSAFSKDSYFDKDGNRISKEEYNKARGTKSDEINRMARIPIKEELPNGYTCRQVAALSNLLYFDKDGKQISKDEYNKAKNA